MKKYKKISLLLAIILILNTSCMRKEKGEMPEHMKVSNKRGLVNYLYNMELGGKVGDILDLHNEAFVLRVLEDNPGLFDGFLDPENSEISKTMWHGEFPGKILTGIAQMYLLNRDKRILKIGDAFVENLKKSQGEDGYLGPWPEDKRFSNDSVSATEGPIGKWDTWGHYHCIYGLYRYYQVTGNTDAIEVAKKALDCVIEYFIEGDISFASQKWSECNLAISHVSALMYELTNENKYLELAKYIVDVEWINEYLDFYSKKILKPDWLTSSLEGIAFGESNQRRWESLYTLSTLGVLYTITGEDKYFKAFDSLWWGMKGYDRHNIGSFGTGEGATKDSYGNMSETCNTVAWACLSAEYLKVTKNSAVADELEMSFFNASLGSLNGDNRIFSYANYSDGARDSADLVLAGHSYINAPDMSCCQASGTRGISSLSDWAILTSEEGNYLNYYGKSNLSFYTKSGELITLIQETDYPSGNKVNIKVQAKKKKELNLYLRIPQWSKETKLKVNGKEHAGVNTGSYYLLKVKDGDNIELLLDMSLHFWLGEESSSKRNKASIYYGPLLLGVDETEGIRKTMKIDYSLLKRMEVKLATDSFVEGKVETTVGVIIKLKDYAHLGKVNNVSYFTWFSIVNHPLTELNFSRENIPRWCQS